MIFRGGLQIVIFWQRIGRSNWRIGVEPEMETEFSGRDTPLEQIFLAAAVCAMKDPNDRARSPVDAPETL